MEVKKLKYYAIGEIVSIGRGLYIVRRSERGHRQMRGLRP